MTLASPFGITAGRSPSCAVPPIMALMTDEQRILGHPEILGSLSGNQMFGGLGGIASCPRG
jgi:hypothetical protein